MADSEAPIRLSMAEVGPNDVEAVARAVRSGWLSPVGPALDQFERELADVTGRRFAVGLSSGTAALQLGLIALGVQPGDEVWVATLTFVATANAVLHAGARPTFFEVDPETWTIDAGLVRAELDRRLAQGEPLPRAIVPVDLYGRCADLGDVEDVLRLHGVAVLTDAAESLGATVRGSPAGSRGDAAALSFNGNKIITTSGGGALLTDDPEVAERVRHLSTQARQPVRHYEHLEAGFNFRLSNVLAALGSSQLADLDGRVERRRAIHARYLAGLSGLSGLRVVDPTRDLDDASITAPSRWLTCIMLDPSRCAVDRDALIDLLEARSIECRPVWKPMHLQPLFQDSQTVGVEGGVSERAFHQGVALPSGSGLAPAQVDRVIASIRAALT